MAESIPDAVMVPLGYSGPGDAATRLTKLHVEFSTILQVPRVYVRHQGTKHFLSGSPADTLLFPHSDPRSGRPRYAWSDRGDGVSYGGFRVDHE
jgi:hypothetical protein